MARLMEEMGLRFIGASTTLWDCNSPALRRGNYCSTFFISFIAENYLIFYYLKIKMSPTVYGFIGGGADRSRTGAPRDD
jgi:hypothetical protein